MVRPASSTTNWCYCNAVTINDANMFIYNNMVIRHPLPRSTFRSPHVFFLPVTFDTDRIMRSSSAVVFLDSYRSDKAEDVI